MGLRVKGIDLSKTLIDIAARRFPYISFQVNNFMNIQERDASYDHALISFNGLDHATDVKSRQTALRECRRILRPGGTFIFSSHNLQSYLISPFYTLHGKFLHHLKRLPLSLREHVVLRDCGQDVFYTTPRFIAREIAESGFTLLERVGLRGQKSPLWLSISPEIHYICHAPLC